MIETIEKTKVVFGKEIKAIVIFTDHGITAVIAGGDRAHMGAVSMVDENGKIQTTTFPTHKETIIAENWGKALYEKYQQPVLVSAGIHYDDLSKEGIMTVVETSARLLEEMTGERTA